MTYAMETFVIELTSQKAYKIIKELEELHIIRVIKESLPISSLRGQLQTPMTNEDIDKQLSTIRKDGREIFN
ncbi:hypothetical protein [Mucilaginibacter sp.]|uniref:hypothetical protein n=1 Tax=Mucilaginibacter sp. TaxID=1882438 RepID=UPI002623E99F|nr:hypothetical protein [Mucilaginibacter sp.]MDB4925594.1 hypothetical protein [Mucilaginibacter sp.]